MAALRRGKYSHSDVLPFICYFALCYCWKNLIANQAKCINLLKDASGWKFQLGRLYQTRVWSEVCLRFQCLLKLPLWIKGVEWVKALNALGPLCLWKCIKHLSFRVLSWKEQNKKKCLINFSLHDSSGDPSPRMNAQFSGKWSQMQSDKKAPCWWELSWRFNLHHKDLRQSEEGTKKRAFWESFDPRYGQNSIHTISLTWLLFSITAWHDYNCSSIISIKKENDL